MNKARFEAFSDGLFAFAATLLVLGLALPAAHAASNHELINELVALWPNVLAYALSFAVIGIMWQNHHALFRTVRNIDRMTVFLNLFLLAGTAFIPFVTSTLGTYPDMKAAAFSYGLILSLCSTAYNLMLNHLVKARAFSENIGDATIRSTVLAYRVGWVSYVLAMLLSFALPQISFAAYIAIAIYYLIPRGVDSDISAPP